MTDDLDVVLLVDLHLANMCDFDERGRMRVGLGSDPPLFRMVLAAGGHRWFGREDLDAGAWERLDQLARAERVRGEIPAWLQHREAFREVLGPGVEEYCGPAFVLPERSANAGRAVELGAGDRALLERHMPGWEREFESSRPIGAVIEDGAVVSVCGNARRLSAAVEAGVETAEAYRGRGYARAATAVWASAIRREGMVPLYSTSWDNVASQRVAAALGAQQYAVDYTLR